MRKGKLTSKDLQHLAKLSNLNLSDEELKKIEKKLTDTLAFIKNLKELDTSNTSPTAHTVNILNEYFEDKAKNTRGLKTDEIFANTKNIKGRYFKVKKIL